MPNSAVKRRSADGSVGSPHARVGNCQASNFDKPSVKTEGFFTSIIPNLPHHFANLTPAHPQRTAMYNAGWPKRNQTGRGAHRGGRIGRGFPGQPSAPRGARPATPRGVTPAAQPLDPTQQHVFGSHRFHQALQAAHLKPDRLACNLAIESEYFVDKPRDES